MRLLLRNKQGQAKGIDFMVAAILFLLVMIQMTVFINNLIIRVNIASVQQEELVETQEILNGLIFTPGAPENWGTLQAIPNDFVIGLKHEASPTIDATKINRLGATSATNWVLTYDNIIGSPIFENWDAQILIKPTFDVVITSSSLVGGVVRVQGYAQENGARVSNADYVAYSVGEDGSVQIITGTTSTQGGFTINFPGSLLNFYVVTVQVRISEAKQSFAYTVATNLGTLPSTITLSVIEKNTTNTKYGVKVFSDALGTSASFRSVSLFNTPGGGSTNQNSTSTSINNQYEVQHYIPKNGTAVIVGMQYDGGGNIIGFNVRGFPDFIDSEHTNPLTAPSLNQPDYVLSRRSSSRGVLIIIEVRLWEI